MLRAWRLPAQQRSLRQSLSPCARSGARRTRREGRTQDVGAAGEQAPLGRLAGQRRTQVREGPLLQRPRNEEEHLLGGRLWRPGHSLERRHIERVSDLTKEGQ